MARAMYKIPIVYKEKCVEVYISQVYKYRYTKYYRYVVLDEGEVYIDIEYINIGKLIEKNNVIENEI